MAYFAYEIPGGTLTDPGVVLGPGVVDAPLMPPISVSFPTDGSLPDATFVFDATTYLDAIGIPFAFIELDATLSFLTSGQSDTAAPTVGLNVFSVAHGLPFTWEESWHTEFTGDSSGVNDDGDTVPRGQSSLYVETGTTYIIQLTTPPGNAVQFVLRVSDFGPYTAWDRLPDNTIFTDFPDGTTTFDATPSISGYTPTTFWGKNTVGAVGLDRTTLAGQAFSHAPSMWGHYRILRTFAGNYPAASVPANECAWNHARGGEGTSQFWSSTGDGGGDGTAPVCLSAIPRHGADGGSGMTCGYRSTGGAVELGGLNNLAVDVYGCSQRINLSAIFNQVTASAGYIPFAVDGGGDYPRPLGFSADADLYFEDSDPPTLTDITARGFRLDGASGGVVPRWFLTVVESANGRGWVPTWGPQDPSVDVDWAVDADNPGVFLSSQDAELGTGAWTPIDPTLVSMALAYEAASTDDAYDGGLLLTALPTDIDSTTPPVSGVHVTPGDEVIDERVTTGILVMLQMSFQPARHRWVDQPTLPEVELLTGEIAGDLGNVRTRFFRQ